MSVRAEAKRKQHGLRWRSIKMANEQDLERPPSDQGAQCVVELGVWLARKELERKQRADIMRTTRQVQVDNDE